MMAESDAHLGDKGHGEAQPASTSWPKKRQKRLLLIGGIAVALIGIALIYWLANRGKEKTDNARVDANLVPIAPRVTGQVVAVSVSENQHVEKEQLLFEIDNRDYQAKVTQASADLDSAKAQAEAADAQVIVAEAAARGAFTEARASLAGSSRSVSAAKAQVNQARASLASREAALSLDEIDLQRARELRKAKAVPQQQLDRAQARFDSIQAEVVAARAKLSAARQELHRAQAQVDASEGKVVISRPVDANIVVARSNAAYQHALVKSAQAKLTLAQLNLRWTHIVAPDEGTISSITAYPGAQLAAGQTVAQFVPTRKYVTANFKETQVGKMRPGQRAEVQVDTYGKSIPGQIESLAGGTGARFSLFPPDNATGNYVKVAQRIPVRIALEEIPANMILRAGQSVEVTVYLME